ncbi:branched-chain amino acid ABC transporter permease [Martelella sp. HB161492]|uniref:branched-chain amino acid ABC transporter permease n=1 Tax=Martelella sp. HB161492 TaxID=2720726 RepID=UPI0015913F4C|nr:branched-chain amino acid ABC transporter permease [Martelella sp. HB161492]
MKKSLPILAVGVVVALAPVLGASSYILGVGVLVFAYLVSAMSLNIIYGLLGLLSLAHVAFWGIGGYVAVIAVVDHGVSFWLAVPLAGLAAGILSILVGYPALRLNRHSFVVVTLSLTLLATLVSRDWMGVTRGPMGIPGLPAPNFFGISLDGPLGFYYLSFAFAAVSLGLMYIFFTSRLAGTMRAICQSEELARSQGINPTPYKLLGFFLSAFFTAMAGGIYAFHMRVIDPLIFDFYFMQAFLIIVIVGGRGSFTGVLISGAIMAILPEVLRFSVDLRMILYGVILLVFVLKLPEGLAGFVRRRREEKMRLELRQ